MPPPPVPVKKKPMPTPVRTDQDVPSKATQSLHMEFESKHISEQVFSISSP